MKGRFRLLGFLAARVLTLEDAFEHFKTLLMQHRQVAPCCDLVGPGVQLVPLARYLRRFRGVHPPHSVNRPPRSIALYSLSDAKVITEHAISTYFRHYKLYQVRCQ